MVNVIYSGGTVIILAILGVYLPSRLRRRLGIRVPKRVASPTGDSAPVVPQASAPPMHTLLHGSEEPTEPRRRVAYWYHLVAHLIARATKIALKPQQTLREFARESVRTLGPVGDFFLQLSKIVERILYSHDEPTAEEEQKSKILSLAIEEKLKR